MYASANKEIGTYAQKILFAIPESETTADKLTAKFFVADNTVTSKNIEVRLLNKKI